MEANGGAKRVADDAAAEAPAAKQARTEPSAALEAKLQALTKDANASADELAEAHRAGQPTEALLRTSEALQASLRACLSEVKASASAQQQQQQQQQESDDSLVIKVHNLPKWSAPRLQAWMQRQQLEFVSVTKQPEWTYAVLGMPDAETCAKVSARLNAMEISKTKLFVTSVDRVGPPVATIAREVESSIDRLVPSAPVLGTRAGKGSVRPTRTEALPDIRDIVCNNWRKPYSQQLCDKYALFHATMDDITWSLAMQLGDVTQPQWLLDARTKPQGNAPCCATSGIVRSPQKEGYRNKTEFTVGFGDNGKPLAGLFYGNYKDGFMEVADAATVPHVSRVAKAMAALFTRFLQSDQCQLPAWDKCKKANCGFWRLLTVREGREATYFPPSDSAAPWDKTNAQDVTLEGIDTSAYTIDMELQKRGTGEVVWWPKDEAVAKRLDAPEATPPVPDDVMVMAQVSDSYGTAAERQAELKRWAAFFKAETGPETPCNSFLLQYHQGCGNAAPPGAPICVCPGWEDTGSAQVGLTDTMGHLKFRIAPDGFYQVNTAAAACLYKRAAEWAAATGNTVLLDICCGAGTIGMTMAHRVKRVIGIDCIQSSIKDAIAAAAANNITNCHFICGSAEDVLDRLLATVELEEGDDLVAILDPPRAGLHQRALYALLGCARIKRIVYVSCNLESLASNVAELMTPSRAVKRPHVPQGDRRSVEPQPPKFYTAFAPVHCQAVDMFPQTSRVESVMCLER